MRLNHFDEKVFGEIRLENKGAGKEVDMGFRDFVVNKTNGAKRVVAALALLLLLSFCLGVPVSYAEETPGTETEPESGDETDGNQSTINDLQGDLAGVRDDLDIARGQYADAEKELKALNAQIAALEEEIAAVENEIDILQESIDEYSAIVFDLLEQIVVLDREINDANSSLNKRLRVMYMTDDHSVLAVLLGSESFIELLSNLEMVRRIHESDKAFLAELEQKLNDVEAKKEEVQVIEGMLKSQRDALRESKNKLDENKAELAVARQRAKEIRDKVAAEIARLEEESKRIEQELVNLTSQWGDYAGGAMAWPVIGPITSGFGNRIHPITGRWTMHNGIDIGAKSGTPIHAAADGYVYFAGWNTGGYGNLVMLDNGSGIVTMYAHCSGFAVKTGQVVHRGDIIAYVGSTGNSTGPHLHFEVRVKGTPQNPMGWLG